MENTRHIRCCRYSGAMFSALRKEKDYKPQALALYKAAMNAARKPEFYKSLGVPDTMDGRFDLLMVHMFIILHVLDQGEGPLAQALFDVCFTDVDQALRESGVGDMKIGKHMKKMMLAFNGRMHAYAEALESGGLEEALARNLYATVEKPKAAHIKTVAGYMKDSIKAASAKQIEAGRISFAAPKGKAKP